MAIEGRSMGWLSKLAHLEIKIAMQHCLSRYRLFCPAYILMPDHAHFLFQGVNIQSDQKKANRFLRREFNKIIDPLKLQHQAYDHILRENEKTHPNFNSICNYIFQNAQRQQLVADWQEWEFLGAIIPGFPSIQPRNPSF